VRRWQLHLTSEFGKQITSTFTCESFVASFLIQNRNKPQSYTFAGVVYGHMIHILNLLLCQIKINVLNEDTERINITSTLIQLKYEIWNLLGPSAAFAAKGQNQHSYSRYYYPSIFMQQKWKNTLLYSLHPLGGSEHVRVCNQLASYRVYMYQQQSELLGQFRLIGDRASDVSGRGICLTPNVYAEI